MTILSNDSTNKTGTVKSEFKNKILNGEHNLENIAQNAGERVGAMASDFADKTAKTVRTGREYVKDNPFKGIALAATAGLLAGSLLTMIMRSRKS